MGARSKLNNHEVKVGDEVLLTDKMYLCPFWDKVEKLGSIGPQVVRSSDMHQRLPSRKCATGIASSTTISIPPFLPVIIEQSSLCLSYSSVYLCDYILANKM